MAHAQLSRQSVSLDGQPVIVVGGIPALTPQERAGLLEGRLESIMTDPAPPVWVVVGTDAGFALRAGQHHFAYVTPFDLAVNAEPTAAELARVWRDRLQAATDQAYRERSLRNVLAAAGLAVLVTIAGLLGSWLILRGHRRLRQRLMDLGGIAVSPRFGTRLNEYFAGIDLRPALQRLNVWGLWLVLFAIWNTYFFLVLGLFPRTRSIHQKILGAFVDAVALIIRQVLGYAPKLVTIACIGLVAYWAVAILGFMFRRMQSRPEELGFGLPVDILMALGKVVSLLVWLVALMVIAPLLPGLGTQTGQVIALLAGAMVTLGSSSAIGNAVAGFVLIYMRPFQVGDRLRLGDIEGDLLEQSFVAIRIRTIKNEVVTVPSSKVFEHAIVNYSTETSHRSGLILHVGVSLGYGVPRHLAERLLIEAARRTDGAVDAPAPFVLIRSLGDDAISYELNATTFFPHARPIIDSELQKNIIDVFDEAGVEILSPRYRAIRDGNPTTLGEDHVPAGYTAPAFRVSVSPGDSKPLAHGAVPFAHAPGHHRPSDPETPPVEVGIRQRYPNHPHYQDLVRSDAQANPSSRSGQEGPSAP